MYMVNCSLFVFFVNPGFWPFKSLNIIGRCWRGGEGIYSVKCLVFSFKFEVFVGHIVKVNAYVKRVRALRTNLFMLRPRTDCEMVHSQMTTSFFLVCIC